MRKWQPRSRGYISRAKADRDFWLHEVRVIPGFVPEKLMAQMIAIEEAYRLGRLNRFRANILAMHMKKKYNLYYRIIDEDNLIFLPPSASYLIDCFSRYPNIMSIIGDRFAGKTITAWTIGLDMLERMDNAKLYVYGDVDGIGDILQDKIDNLIVKKDYSIPPPDDKPKIVIYNELSRELLSKYAKTKENIEINLQAFRARHRYAWIIYNVVRHSSLESVLRETSTIHLFKWLSGLLLKNAMELVPYGWRDVLKITAHFGHEEGLAIVPQIKQKGGRGKTGRRGGTEFFIHLTKPPKFLLDAAKKAEKNKLLMMSESERERKIFEVINQLYEELGKIPTSGQVRNELMLKHNIEYSKRHLRNYIRDWKHAMGIEK